MKAFSITLMTLLLVVAVTEAADARYDHWLNDLYVSGDRHEWEPPYPHESVMNYGFNNTYVQVENTKAGHFGISIDFHAGLMLRNCYPEGNFRIRAFLRISSTESILWGMQVHIITNPDHEVFPDDFTADIKFENLDGTPVTGEVWHVDLDQYKIRFKFRTTICPDLSPRYVAIAYQILKVSLSDNVTTTALMEHASFSATTSCNASYIQYGYTIHCDFGNMLNGRFWVQSRIEDIGHHCDKSYQDFYCGIDDIFLVASLFGKTPGAVGGYMAWWWTTDCWKADVNGDAYIGIDDINYIASHFGSEG